MAHDIDKFKDFNENYLIERYKHKKEQCKKRLIPFEFTITQWLEFHKILYSGVKCAYLNQEFIFDPKHCQFPTIERLSDIKGYSVHNCVWVCDRANTIKDQVVKGKKSEEFENGLKNFAKRIEKIVANKELIEIIQEPYKQLFTLEQGEYTLEQNIITTSNNSEIMIAQLYAGFGNFIEDKCASTYNLSYNDYKKLISRKKCQLTGRQLPKDLSQIGLFVVDKSQDVSKENVLVTSKDVQNALDTMIVSSKLSLKELKTLCNVIGKGK